MIHVIVKPDGEVVFEADDVDQAVEIAVKAVEVAGKLRSAALTKPTPVKPKPAVRKRLKPKSKPKPKVESTPLSPQLLTTWEWVAAQSGGVTLQEVAAHFDLKESAVSYRLRQLIEKGLISREGKLYFVGQGEGSE